MPFHETITHRNLPHWFVPGAAHFVTYRLAGTIPVAVLAELRSEREARIAGSIPAEISRSENKARAHKAFFSAYDRYLDSHCPISWLAQEQIAALIRENLHHHAGTLYNLLAYCVMPNHVHVLLMPLDSDRPNAKTTTVPQAASEYFSDETADRRSPLAKIMHSIKSYTANRANEHLKREGQFWQHESYDHWVRDERELRAIIEYIHLNPVRAGLVKAAQDWEYSSVKEMLYVP